MKKLIPIIFLICLFSCKTENKTNLNTENEVELKEQIKKAESKIEIKYVIAKSGLNYRKTPKGEVVGKFEYSEKLIVIEHSNIFESINDENKLIKGEWLGIKFNDTIFYTFDGYLSNEKPILEPKENLYNTFLKNKKDVILNLKNTSSEQANELFEHYFKENNSLISQITGKEIPFLDKFYHEEELHKKNIKNLGEKLQKYDLEFDEIGEGYVEIKTVFNFYYKIFSNYVSDDYKEYLYLKSEENKTTYQSDAGLIISFKDLGERIISWENFINKYPNSKLLKNIKEEHKSYQLDYLIGLDNTPTTEGALRGREAYIYPENIVEFNRFQKKHPNSPTSKMVGFFKENFKNEKIINLLREKQNTILEEYFHK
ncbi:hypothetical protein [Cellulophaga sp. Asnod2-G02]|uniref:hypothetical protein n=1 Tax=Cellulophaga sp. Asnod2-G02 TaxID=3160572 RepID=UPI0038646EC6